MSSKMKTLSATLLLVLLCTASLSARPKAMPQGFADSLLRCTVERAVPAAKYVWNWRDAVVLKALTDLYDLRPELRPTVEEYVLTAMRATAERVHGNHPHGVASGVGLAFLVRAGLDDGTFGAAADKVYRQYCRIGRWQGATSHRPGRIELWDDTVYMLTVYLLEMYRATGDERYLDDCVREITAHAAQLRNPATGLWYHGWSATNYCYEDDCCEYLWNSNQLQRNTEYWGRGNGWIAMSLADVLALLPAGHRDRSGLKAMFVQMMRTLCRVQDPATGHWRQLPLRVEDAGAGNYIESSATAMFGYALAKGVAEGVLRGGRYRKAAERAWKGLLAYSVEGRGTDSLTLGNVCAGTCIGERRYYYARPVVSGESFATGAFLQFAGQMDRLDRR